MGASLFVPLLLFVFVVAVVKRVVVVSSGVFLFVPLLLCLLLLYLCLLSLL